MGLGPKVVGVGENAVKGLAVGGWVTSVGTGAGLGSSFLGTGTRGAASLEVRTSSPPGMA